MKSGRAWTSSLITPPNWSYWPWVAHVRNLSDGSSRPMAEREGWGTAWAPPSIFLRQGQASGEMDGPHGYAACALNPGAWPSATLKMRCDWCLSCIGSFGNAGARRASAKKIRCRRKGALLGGYDCSWKAAIGQKRTLKFEAKPKDNSNSASAGPLQRRALLMGVRNPFPYPS